MSKYFTAIILSSLIFSSLFAEIAQKFSVEGNKRISSETIKVYGDIKLNKDYSESDLNVILNNLYKTEFFEDVKISFTNNELRVVVKEHPFVDQLIIVGEKSNKYQEQIKKIISTKEKRSFVKSKLNKDVNMIKNLYSSIGYNSAKVEFKTKLVSEDKLDVLIEIDRGNKTKISSIEFIGNNKFSSRKLRDIISSE